MICAAVTGGVACGKSLVCSELVRSLPEDRAHHFSCDACVADLLASEEVQGRIRSLPGGSALFPEGRLDKGLLRERLFENSEFRENVESILHPGVLEEASAFVERYSAQVGFVLVEVPLLYEVDFPLKRDFDITVAASRSTQVSRICEKRGLSQEDAERIIDTQLPIEEKMERADLVLWNDGQRTSLEAQIEHLAGRCTTLFR